MTTPFSCLGSMCTILDALTSRFLTNLGEIIQDEVDMNVKKDIKRLKNNMGYLGVVREDVEALAMQDRGIESWWKNITGVMFDN